MASYGKFQSKLRNEGKDDTRCRYCSELGHVQSHCKKHNICNYCKKSGHISLNCRALKNKQGHVAFVTMGNDEGKSNTKDTLLLP